MIKTDWHLFIWLNPSPSLGFPSGPMMILNPKDTLEQEMVTHSSILPWRIPWTEEPGRLQPMESPWVGRDWANTGAPTGPQARHFLLKCKLVRNRGKRDKEG